MMSPSTVSARYSYRVYGADVTSAIPLGLPDAVESEDDSRAHVEFVEGSDQDFIVFRGASADVDHFVCEDIRERGTYLRWSRFYEFHVHRSGHRVACRPLDGCDSSVLRNFLLGQVIGVALVRQGVEPLHASVVAIDGAAIALVGDCAYGKSTLLASLVQAGFRVVTDDMLIVERSEDLLYAMPGAGRIKLMPGSANRFWRGAAGMPLTPLTSKQAFTLDESQRQRVRVPLRLLYILPTPDDRDNARAIEICEMSQVETVHELVRNTFSPHLLDRQRLVHQFDHATAVASRTKAFRLRYPTGLEHVPEVRQALIEHAQHIVSTIHTEST